MKPADLENCLPIYYFLTRLSTKCQRSLRIYPQNFCMLRKRRELFQWKQNSVQVNTRIGQTEDRIQELFEGNVLQWVLFVVFRQVLQQCGASILINIQIQFLIIEQPTFVK